MTLIVTGAAGYVGRHVCRCALALGMSVVGTYHRGPADVAGVVWLRLDVTDTAAVSALLKAVAPTSMIHAAAGLAPGLDPLAATVNWSTNAKGAAHVARAAAAVGARLVHVSSDAVFSGRATPFTEVDPPSPVYPYGAAKAAAELAVAELMPTAAIARTSLVNSDCAGSELSVRERFILDLVTGRVPGVLFTDDVRCPIAVTDLAAALVELATTDHVGIVHVAGPDAVSFHQLGVLVARRHGHDPARVPASTIAESGHSRPGHVRLDSSLAGQILTTRLRGIQELFVGA